MDKLVIILLSFGGLKQGVKGSLNKSCRRSMAQSIPICAAEASKHYLKNTGARCAESSGVQLKQTMANRKWGRRCVRMRQRSRQNDGTRAWFSRGEGPGGNQGKSNRKRHLSQTRGKDREGDLGGREPDLTSCHNKLSVQVVWRKAAEGEKKSNVLFSATQSDKKKAELEKGGRGTGKKSKGRKSIGCGREKGKQRKKSQTGLQNSKQVQQGRKAKPSSTRTGTVARMKGRRLHGLFPAQIAKKYRKHQLRNS